MGGRREGSDNLRTDAEVGRRSPGRLAMGCPETGFARVVSPARTRAGVANVRREVELMLTYKKSLRWLARRLYSLFDRLHRRIADTKRVSLLDKLEAETAKERARALDLQKMLEAKQSLMTVRAKNNELRKKIAGTSEKTVEKDAASSRIRR